MTCPSTTLVKGTSAGSDGGGCEALRDSRNQPDDVAEQEADEAKHGGQDGPGAEAVRDAEPQVAGDDPEPGVVDVREAERAERDREGQQRDLDRRVSAAEDGGAEQARSGEDRDGRRPLGSASEIR